MSSQWLLSLVEPGSVPAIVACGTSPKNSVPVPGFLRSRSDSGAALAAISTCTSGHTPTSVHISPKRAVQARPVLGSDEAVRGVWFRVTDPVDTGEPPLSWSFDWNMTAGIALVPGSPAVARSLLGVAEVMTTLDFGDRAADVLTMLVSAELDTRLAVDATQLWSDGTTHQIRVLARVCESKAGERWVRGIAYDYGVSHRPNRSPSTIGDIIASSAPAPRTCTAIVDLDTLETLHWHGPPPDTVAWRFDEADHRPRVHPDDDDAVQALASATRDKSADRKEIVVRFRAPDGGYSPHTVTSLPIDLDEHGADRPRLALVTLAECSSGGSPS
ncbi:GAF domain-containing protein [Rhodococcoides kroppenstedtii]|uniref:GAF domain-containing protein n=1 Tax=Rhodococcoides kroppenstedtii TaxID=293050 RepID=UPI001427CC53|nr:GAF domain-containing protein [Rhodococcus kroppenstedtii]NIL80369.1 hypothetical protein [Rhodococcus kroppenstedtii]